jgi:WD40 repeat protein
MLLDDIDPPHGLRFRFGLSANRAKAKCHAWSTNGQHLAGYFSNGKIYLWESINGKREMAFDLPSSTITGLSWSPNNNLIAAASQDGQVYILAINSTIPQRQIHTSAKRIINVCWSPDSHYLNLASVEQNAYGEQLVLQSWDITTGKLIASLDNLTWDKAYTAFSPQQRMLGLALREGLVQVWDLQTMKLIGDFEGPHAMLYSLEYLPEKEIIALGWDNGWIDIWSSKNTGVQNTLQKHHNAVFSLSFSNSGKLLASRSLDQRILLWNCADWNIVAEIYSPCNKESQVELAFQPSGAHLLIAGGQDQILEIWEVDEKVLLNKQQSYSLIIEQLKVEQMNKQITVEGSGNVVTVGDDNIVENTITVGHTTDYASLDQLLSELTKEINRLHESAPTEVVESMTNDAESLKREAKSKAPRNQKIQTFVEDLKKAATNLAEIGEPVLKIVSKLIPILLIKP